MAHVIEVTVTRSAKRRPAEYESDEFAVSYTVQVELSDNPANVVQRLQAMGRKALTEAMVAEGYEGIRLEAEAEPRRVTPEPEVPDRISGWVEPEASAAEADAELWTVAVRLAGLEPEAFEEAKARVRAAGLEYVSDDRLWTGDVHPDAGQALRSFLEGRGRCTFDVLAPVPEPGSSEEE